MLNLFLIAVSIFFVLLLIIIILFCVLNFFIFFLVFIIMLKFIFIVIIFVLGKFMCMDSVENFIVVLIFNIFFGFFSIESIVKSCDIFFEIIGIFFF